MSIRMGMPHMPSTSNRRLGKWQTKDSLWKYKLARRKANKLARRHRQINRGVR